MLNTKLNAQQGFHLRLCGPPNAITPEQVLRLHRSKRRGGMGGQVLSPPSSYQCFLFYPLKKEFSRAELTIIKEFKELQCIATRQYQKISHERYQIRILFKGDNI